MGEVIDLVSDVSVDTAWRRLQTLYRQAVDHPHLREDPEHKRKRRSAADTFIRLFHEWCQL